VEESREQVETRPITVYEIMCDPAFAAGVNDVRNGRPFNYDYSSGDRWGYERGRQWACLAPTRVPLKIRGKPNLKALTLCCLAFDRKYII
jgi:hypothetical protein